VTFRKSENETKSGTEKNSFQFLDETTTGLRVASPRHERHGSCLDEAMCQVWEPGSHGAIFEAHPHPHPHELMTRSVIVEKKLAWPEPLRHAYACMHKVR